MCPERQTSAADCACSRRFACLLFLSGVFGSPAAPILFADEPVTRANSAPKRDVVQKGVVLTPNDSQTSFDFETEQIQGTIRVDGAYHGVTRLVDKQTGRQVIDPRYSALNLFRLFSVNQGMGQPRTMERTIQVTP